MTINQRAPLFMAVALASLWSSSSYAAGINASADDAQLSNVTVSGQAQVGEAVSASMGTVVAEQIEQRPISRAGEVLETVPGLIVTQHSGEGKANQYFLRGFNLDHGTDFATFIDGMPVNMRTHGHGQGYTDINFLIPELVESLDYKKGPYYASEGDFANAGAVRIHTRQRLNNNLLKIGVGEYGYQRVLLAGGSELNNGDELIAALDTSRYDGPWEVEQEQEKYSGLIKYSFGNSINGGAITAMAYQNDWTATEQLPERYINELNGDRFDSLDDDTGGKTHRRSLSYEGWNDFGGRELRTNAYLIDYGLKLYANHTYAIDQDNGDEFHQHDERKILGGSALLDLYNGEKTQWQAGMDLRHDRISDVGLAGTQNRDIYERRVRHRVEETGLGLFVQNNHQWSSKLRTQIGARFDYISAIVKNRLENNDSSGESDTRVSPKFSLIYQLAEQTQVFANYGQGFHSNDARGFAEQDATPLVQSEGADLGLQTQLANDLQLAVSLWWLTLDSELIFVGDDGTTEASDKSERRGVEASVFWQPQPWLILDSDLAFSRARLKPEGEKEQYIPGAVEQVFSLGMTIDGLGDWNAGLRLRHFGKFALNEDNSRKADAVTLLNAQANYQVTPSVQLGLELINLTDEEGNDITYLYESRLPGEDVPAGAEGIEDEHFHPVEPRMVRANLTYEF